MNYYSIAILLVVTAAVSAVGWEELAASSPSAPSSPLPDIIPQASAQSTDSPTVITNRFSSFAINEGAGQRSFNLLNHFNDPDSDDLTWRVTVTKDGAALTDQMTFVIGGFSGNTLFIRPNHNDGHGVYEFTVFAREGSNPEVSQSGTITVNNVNRAIVAPDSITVPAVSEGASVNVNLGTLGASDPDGPISCQPITSDFYNLAADCTFTSQTDENYGGNNFAPQVMITGTNNDGAPQAIDRKTVNLGFVILEVNEPPVSTDIPAQSVNQEEPFNYDASTHFMDSDRIGTPPTAHRPDAPAYTLGGTPPDWLSIDGTTGVFSGTPTQAIIDATTTNPFTVTVIATDHAGATAQESFELTLVDVNIPPTIQIPDNLYLVPGGTYTFDLSGYFADADGDDVMITGFTYDGDAVSEDTYVLEFPNITFTVPLNADLSKPLMITLTDTGADPATSTETLTFGFQPTTIARIPAEEIEDVGGLRTNNGDGSSTSSDMPISTVRLQSSTQTFDYTVAFYDYPAPSLARVSAPNITDEQITHSKRGLPIQFLPGVVDITADNNIRALLTLTYTEPIGIDELNLSIWHFERGNWVELRTESRDVDANTISAITRSFSPFAIGVAQAAPPQEGGSSSSIEHLKAPTFGKSKLNNNQVVECGYSMDGQCIDVLNYHEEYQRQIILTNSTHDFTLKAFGQSPIKQFQIGFGVPGVGEPINSAEAVIRVAVTQDSKSAYSVDTVEIIDKDNTIDFDPQNAGVQKASCTNDDILSDNNSTGNDAGSSSSSKTPQCVELALNGVLFREQFHSEPFVIHVMDSSRRSSHNYMNEGLLIQGTSLNPPPVASKLGMPVGTSDLVSFELTRTDKLANVWTDQFGHTWTQNQFGTWLQLTYPDVRHDDYDNGYDNAKSAKVMTRVHSDFADLVMGQQNRATLVFDAAGITNSAPGTFSHDYFGADYDLSKTQKLAEQLKIEQDRAQKTLDSIMGRQHHNDALN